MRVLHRPRRMRIPALSTRRSGLLLLLALVAPVPGTAQADPMTEPGPLLDRGDAWAAAAFVAAGFAMLPFDGAIAAEIQDSLFQELPGFRQTATAFKFLGFPGSVIIGGGLYGAGRIFDNGDMADVGLHVTEAILVAEAMTYTVKLLAGRARPSLDVAEPYDFRFARGFRGEDWQALPSGHTTAAFATAGASARELSRLWPGHDLLVGVLTYGPAALVGASRMFDNRHWASDVVFGAAIGSVTGWALVEYNHDRPGNRVDRVFLTVSAPPGRLTDVRLGIAFGR